MAVGLQSGGNNGGCGRGNEVVVTLVSTKVVNAIEVVI